MAKYNIVVLSVLLIQLFVSGESLYTGYHVFAVTPHSASEVDSLAQYLSNQVYIDIWTLPRHVDTEAKFMVPGDISGDVESWLKTNNIEYNIETDDVQRLVDAQNGVDIHSRSKSRLNRNWIDLNVYNDHDDMNSFLTRIAEDCDICSIINIGQSYEGRDMLVIKIGHWSPSKKAVWLDAGIHAREWISPATALQIINYMIYGYRSAQQDMMFLLDHFIFFVLPSANPDGYMHSREEERFWRKTRKPTRQPECIGTDPNRNWNYHWAESGVSPDPCSQVYPGASAFSQPETDNIRKFLWRRRKNMLVYLSLHSYGRYWLYPNGFDDSLPDDWEELHRVGLVAVNTIRRTTGQEYTLGTPSHIMYSAAGISMDWAKGVAGIKYSYTIELPDDGTHGFLLPPSAIEETIIEIGPALIEMLRAIQDNFDGDQK